MAQSKGSKGNSGNKGFGSMDENKKREIARQGGRASAQGDTSNRGFASMDKDKQREISSQGGKASHAGVSRKDKGSTAENKLKKSDAGKNVRANEKDNKLSNDIEVSARDLNSLKEEDDVETGNASVSETDEDEDEGVGDGNLGRSRKSLGSDEEG